MPNVKNAKTENGKFSLENSIGLMVEATYEYYGNKSKIKSRIVDINDKNLVLAEAVIPLNELSFFLVKVVSSDGKVLYSRKNSK